MDWRRKQRTVPHPNLPRFVPDGRYESDDYLPLFIMGMFGGGILSFFVLGIPISAVICALTPLGFNDPAGPIIAAVIAAVYEVAFTVVAFVLPRTVWRFQEFATEDQAKAARRYAGFSAEKKVDLRPAYRALVASNADNYRSALELFRDTSNAYDCREAELRRLIPNPHLAEAREALEYIRTHTETIRDYGKMDPFA